MKICEILTQAMISQPGGRRMRVKGDMQTEIAGHPCQIVVTSVDGQFDFDVYDMKGQRATWLMAKMSDEDVQRIEREWQAHQQQAA